jgi:hypothetical protein
MIRYNEELAMAGVLLAADGLNPSSSAMRISYPEPGGKPKIANAPFTEAKETIAGYTLIEVKSREEAVYINSSDRVNWEGNQLNGNPHSSYFSINEF